MAVRSRPTRSESPPSPPRRHLPVEPLEPRTLLATYYVDDVAANGNGSFGNPWNSIQHALNNVVAGDVISLRGGTYRQTASVQLNRHGTAGNFLTIQAYSGETPVITGSDVVTGWVHHAGNVWKKAGWAANSQQVFDDGVPLQQVGMPTAGGGYDSFKYPTPVGTGLADMAPGRFWLDYTPQDQDPTNNTLYVQLADNSDPNSSTMEVSVRSRLFFAEAGRGYLHLKGLTFEHGNATTLGEQFAMAEVSSHSIVENCTFTYSDFSGLSLGFLTTGVRVLGSTFTHNGAVGISGATTTDFLIRGNTISDNNYRNFNPLWHAGGIKVAADAWGEVDGNEISFNNGSGVWFDFCDTTGNTKTISNNYIHDNGPKDAAVFFEKSNGALIYNNVIVDNERRGIFVSGSDDVKIYNNTIVRTRGHAAIDVSRGHGVQSTNVRVENNILHNGTSGRDMFIEAGTGNVINYNNIYRSSGSIRLYYDPNPADGTFPANHTSLSAWQAATPFDDDSKNVSPDFATASGDDYQLTGTSPLVDAGVTHAEVTADYAGAARPQGAGTDMGGYERAAVVTHELVGHWALDENTGTTAADASGKNNTGTLTNGPAWTTGQVGAAALTFDGANDYVNVPSGNSLNVTSGLTIAGWFYRDGTGGGNTTGIDKQSAYRLTAGSSGASTPWTFFFWDAAGVSHAVTTTAPVSNDAWHHVAGTYDGTTLRIYVDGVQAATPVSFSGTIRVSGAPLRLGVRDNAFSYFAGKMDDVRVYNYAISAGDVAALASTLSDGLAAHYQLDENTGTTATDASGNNNTGALVNGPAWTAGHVGAAALSFDGTNDYVSVPDSATLDITAAITVGGWFYHNSTGGGSATGVDKKNAYRLTAQQKDAASSNWQFFFKDPGGGIHTVTTATAITNDAWHHVVGTYDGATIKIYVDGALAGTASYTGSIGTSNEQLRIGVRDSVVSYFAGKMDDVRIYDRALSATEVSAWRDLAGGGSPLMASTTDGGASAEPAPRTGGRPATPRSGTVATPPRFSSRPMITLGLKRAGLASPGLWQLDGLEEERIGLRSR